jgi:hypothetical protein
VPAAVVDARGADLDASRQAPAGQVRHPLEHRGPHVQLDLLAHTKVVVQQVRETVARARPRFDAELEQLARVRREADLARLEMTVERDEAERARRALDHAHGPVPRPRHAHHVLVADREPALLAQHLVEAREFAGRHAVEVGGHRRDQLLRPHSCAPDARMVDAVEERPEARLGMLDLVFQRVCRQVGRIVRRELARDLAAMQGGRPPHVAPGRQRDADGPTDRGAKPTSQRRTAWHPAVVPRPPRERARTRAVG